MKSCRTCGEVLPLDAFYAHPRMKDGHVNHCKECQKTRIKNQRQTDPRIREYDRWRNRAENLTPARRASALRSQRKRRSQQVRQVRFRYRQSPEAIREYKRQWAKANPDRVKESQKRWSKENRHKRRVHVQTRRAILRGELTRLPCEVCGELKSEAHHEDYDRPLDVRWLCRKHHAEVHRVYA